MAGGDGGRISIGGKIVAAFDGQGKFHAGPPAPGEPAAAAAAEVSPGLEALRWFYDQLTPTDSEMRPVLPEGEPVPSPLPQAVLRRVEWAPVTLFEKRGLTPETCAALGFRANPPGNEEILRAMRDRYDWETLVDSGLWLEADRGRKQERRPNLQFAGKGQAGRKPDNEKRDPDDKWQWGRCQPVLIPYFDERGRLVKLRPHKGGAPVGTAAGDEKIYVPRDYRAFQAVPAPSEKFGTAVIAEGEFKAAALWQMKSWGRILNWERRPELAVCSLPGISFAKNLNYRADLEDWLRRVGCRKVIVGFDDEDKRDKPLRQRFEARKYAQYLAVDLSRKLHIHGVYVILPREWRNAQGKADWDGALAMLYKKYEKEDREGK